MAGDANNTSQHDVLAEKPKRRKRKDASALERSMGLLRAEGYLVGKTEHWHAFAKKRMDLFGFIDLVALGNGKIVAVQVTKNFLNEHITKIRSIAAAQRWLSCGGQIVIHWWRELGPKDGKRWVLEVIGVVAAHDKDTPP